MREIGRPARRENRRSGNAVPADRDPGRAHRQNDYLYIQLAKGATPAPAFGNRGTGSTGGRRTPAGEGRKTAPECRAGRAGGSR